MWRVWSGLVAAVIVWESPGIRSEQSRAAARHCYKDTASPHFVCSIIILTAARMENDAPGRIIQLQRRLFEDLLLSLFSFVLG